jgi:hypothetical protein
MPHGGGCGLPSDFSRNCFPSRAETSCCRAFVLYREVMMLLQLDQRDKDSANVAYTCVVNVATSSDAAVSTCQWL